MITMIQVMEGYEPHWEVWNSKDQYLGEVHLEEFDLFIKGLGVLDQDFEIVGA